MSETVTECHEVAGKTVQRLRLISANSGGQEVHLEFSDGTAFTLTVEPTTTRNARLIVQSESAVETLKVFGG